MSVKISPITPQAHGKTKVKPLSDFSIYKERHMSPLTVHEFTRAASCFPIVFIKAPESEDYKVVSMFSVMPNQNVFVSDEGKWTANYVPQSLARVPFYVSSDDEPVICIDENDARVSEDEGQALFDEAGEKTEYFQKIIDSIQNLMNQDGVTQVFVKKLVDMDLLQSSSLTISKRDGSKQEINGIHIVDETKFKALSDEQVLELNKLGYLGLVYVHLTSLGQTQNLLRE